MRWELHDTRCAGNRRRQLCCNRDYNYLDLVTRTLTRLIHDKELICVSTCRHLIEACTTDELIPRALLNQIALPRAFSNKAAASSYDVPRRVIITGIPNNAVGASFVIF